MAQIFLRQKIMMYNASAMFVACAENGWGLTRC
jgi:hypothetical protein